MRTEAYRHGPFRINYTNLDRSAQDSGGEPRHPMLSGNISRFNDVTLDLGNTRFNCQRTRPGSDARCRFARGILPPTATNA
jgi:hypothetical protein